MAHFGVLLLPQDSTSTHEMLLSHGATACEAAVKQQEGFIYFSKNLQDSLVQRHNLELALTEAISHNFKGFELYHQPHLTFRKT